MESLGLLMGGFQAALTPYNLLFCVIGVTLGMFIGVLPGLGPVAGTAILIPLTFGMDPTPAIIMLSGIFYAAMYGGTITSVLINTPGESASVITCIDGYQMARQGRAGAA
ncbi:MAG: tripartite tricarboxylate transporter permease, partial [Spirochaetota bacterium]